MTTEKLCPACRVVKVAGEFSKSSRAASGLQTYCKDCAATKARANPEQGRARGRRYFESNREAHTWREMKRRALRCGGALVPQDEFIAWRKSQPSVCAYCGIDGGESLRQFDRGISVDRKDPKLGYALSNICLACSRCNAVKNEYLTHEQMKEVAARYFGGSHVNAHDELVAALRHLDEFWARDFPAGPDSPECGYLTDETRSIWRNARAVLAKVQS